MLLTHKHELHISIAIALLPTLSGELSSFLPLSSTYMKYKVSIYGGAFREFNSYFYSTCFLRAARRFFVNGARKSRSR